MQNEHSNEINKLRKDHEEEIANLRNGLGSDLQKALDDMHKRHAEATKSLETQHEEEIKRLNDGFDQKVAQIERNNVEARNQMQEKHDAEMKKLEEVIDDLKQQIQGLLDQIAKLEQEKEAVEQKLQYTEGLIQGMKDQVADAEARTAQSLREHQERTAKIEQDFSSKEQRLQRNLRETLDRMILDQQEEISALQGEFGNASSLMDQKYKMLNENFKEIEQLYNGRPSRPEDLELIKQLQDDILNKEQAIKKAAEDMKFYKLELINREHSYNTMFGTNPNVGVINPVGKNTKMGANMVSQKDILRGKKQQQMMV